MAKRKPLPAPNVKPRKGAPPFEPTQAQREKVAFLKAAGITHEAMAALIGISEPTLEKHFAHELKIGAEQATALVAQSLFHQAVGRPAQYDVSGNKLRSETRPNIVAGIFWLKARAGWTEKMELTGPDGAPLIAPDAARDRLATAIDRLADRLTK